MSWVGYRTVPLSPQYIIMPAISGPVLHNSGKRNDSVGTETYDLPIKYTAGTTWLPWAIQQEVLQQSKHPCQPWHPLGNIHHL